MTQCQAVLGTWFVCMSNEWQKTNTQTKRNKIIYLSPLHFAFAFCIASSDTSWPNKRKTIPHFFHNWGVLQRTSTTRTSESYCATWINKINLIWLLFFISFNNIACFCSRCTKRTLETRDQETADRTKKDRTTPLGYIHVIKTNS